MTDIYESKLEGVMVILGHLRALSEATDDADARACLAKEAANFMRLMGNPVVALGAEDVFQPDYEIRMFDGQA